MEYVIFFTANAEFCECEWETASPPRGMQTRADMVPIQDFRSRNFRILPSSDLASTLPGSPIGFLSRRGSQRRITTVQVIGVIELSCLIVPCPSARASVYVPE